MRRHTVSKCSSSAPLSPPTGTHSAYSLCACACVCVPVCVCARVWVCVRAALCKSVLPIYEPANSASFAVAVVVGADFYVMLFDVDCRLSTVEFMHAHAPAPAHAHAQAHPAAPGSLSGVSLAFVNQLPLRGRGRERGRGPGMSALAKSCLLFVSAHVAIVAVVVAFVASAATSLPEMHTQQ